MHNPHPNIFCPSICISLRWARLGRRPESYCSGADCLSGEVALRLGASFHAILIRGGGPGTPESLLPSKVGGAAHRQTWFWSLLPKQKGLVCRGETLHKNKRLTFHLEVWVEEGTAATW